MTIVLNNALITPDLGTTFWTLVTFILLLVVLRKIAWGPILTGLKNREQSIEDALGEARRAREEMKNLHAQNEVLLAEARAERDKMLKEARETRDNIVNEAKNAAQTESKRIMDQAQQNIEKDRAAAFKELKEEVVTLALDAATKILQRELANKQVQEEVIENYLAQVNPN